MMESDIILLFLKKMRLEKHHSKIISNSLFKINTIDDLQFLLTNVNYLKEIGLSSAEINRFKRLYEKTLKECRIEFEIQKKESATYKTEPSNPTENVVTVEPKCMIDKIEDLKLEEIYPKEAPYVIIRYQIITKISIQTSNKTRKGFKILSCNWVQLRYFEFVETLYTLLQNKHLLINNCSSIEIYHKSGSPIVTKPSDYFKLIHEFNDTDFDFIFIIPKRLEISKEFFNSSSLGLRDYNLHTIPISHFETRSTHMLDFSTSNYNMYVYQLKNECSKYFHLPVSCISISLEDIKHNFEHKLLDKTVIITDDILNHYWKLYLVVSEEYWDPCFLNAFKYDNYLPICEHSSDTLVYLNSYLLFLVRRARLKASPDIVTGCLGLLRKISRYPPLIHSLRLLFSESIITLPHKIALVEGLNTTISLLDSMYVNLERYDIPCLWHYLETNTNTSLIEYERSELVFIQSSAKTPFCNEIELHYRETPQYISNYSAFRQLFFKDTIYTLFPFEHPIELYHTFLKNVFHTGLTTIQFERKNTLCVFYGRSPNTSLHMIDCYSTYHGRLISFNPFEIETPGRHVPSYTNKYSKLFIILDISNDMNNTLDGNNYYPSHISPDNVFCQLDAALILIEIIIDFLISSKLNYLLGITLVSNDHNFQNGFFVFQEMTLEYCYSVKKLRNWIGNTELSENPLPHGGIVNALENYIKKKCSNNTLIFLFTNQHYIKRYYGPNVHNIHTDIQKVSYRVNVVLFGKTFGKTFRTRIETLCKKSRGKLINKCSKKDSSDPMFYCLQFQEYINSMRDLLTENNTPDQLSSFKEVDKRYKNMLSISDQLIGKLHKQDESLDSVDSAILNQLSIYTKDPNPFVRMYSVKEDITQWLLFLKCPPNTSFYGTDHVLSLAFSRKYSHRPPSIKFLTPILHPNIYPNGNICHPILFEDYVPRVTTLKTVIDSILSLLSEPIRTHVINSSIGEDFFLDSYGSKVSTVEELISITSMSRREQEKSLKINLTTSLTPPNYLICPLTKALYNFPVISPDGNTFERSAIIERLIKSQRDPISNNHLTEINLFPNYAIADSVSKYKMNFK